MINPVVFQIGNLRVVYYDLIYFLGFIFGLIVLLLAIKNKEIEMRKSQAITLSLLFVVGLLFGAKLFSFLFWLPQKLLEDPLIIFKPGSGWSFHGGLLGMILVAYIYTKIEKLNFLKIADIITLPGLFFTALGRLSSSLNQNIVGTITSLPFCVESPYYKGCRHPILVYGAIGRFALFFALYAIKQLKTYKEGFLFWSSIFILGLGRFVFDFIREGVKHYGLLSGQWLSIPMILIGGYALLKYYKEDIRKISRS
jgi:phosphatidylglycerol---prolipoprotein diacylglyceryl transferase